MRSYLLMVFANKPPIAPTGPAGQEHHPETTDAQPGVFFIGELVDLVHIDGTGLGPSELLSSRTRVGRALGIMAAGIET